MSNSRNLKRALIGLTLVAAQVVALPMVGAQSPVHAAAGMNVVKSASPGTGSTVDVGDTITYTVTVANTGDEVLTGLTIDDVVPPGATYVPGSSLISGVSQYVQYRDEFTNQDELDSSNGATNWSSTPWVLGADTEIKDGVLTLKKADEQATRAAALVTCATGTSTVSFNYERTDDDIDAVFEMRSSPSATWVQQADLSGNEGSGTISQPIPAAFRVAGAQIQFRLLPTSEDKDLEIDNFQIEQTCTSATAVAAGTPPAFEPASRWVPVGRWADSGAHVRRRRRWHSDVAEQHGNGRQ